MNKSKYTEEQILFAPKQLGGGRRADRLNRYIEQRPHELNGNLAPRQYLMAQLAQPSPPTGSREHGR